MSQFLVFMKKVQPFKNVKIFYGGTSFHIMFVKTKKKTFCALTMFTRKIAWPKYVWSS